MAEEHSNLTATAINAVAHAVETTLRATARQIVHDAGLDLAAEHEDESGQQECYARQAEDAIVVALRAVWNARGEADAKAVEDRLATLTGWVTSEPYRQHMREAIKDNDR